MEYPKFFLKDDTDTVKFGQELASVTPAVTTIFLLGGLGAGKTTMTRGFVQGFGYEGVVKSPTYTLVEPYRLQNVTIYHFDLYRLNEPEELELMGIRDYFGPDSIRLVEWPENGGDVLAGPDVTVALAYEGVHRSVTISPVTELGLEICKNFIAISTISPLRS